MIPLSDHASHWSNYLGELIREMPLYYLSWQKVPAKRKAAIVTKIETQFDLKPHMQSQTYNVESIRQRRPENITLADWDAQLTFWNDPRNQARAAQNRQNRSKSTVMESSSTLRVPIADPHLLHDIHCWRGSNTEMGVPYTEEEIMAIVQTGKQQGHLSGVGRIYNQAHQALMAISSSSSSSSSDKEVQNCSKQCLESFKTLQKNFDSEREKHSRARLEIQGYELALESLESRILGHEKNELAWGEKYEFQNYELKCREVKIDNLKMELEKVVKERDELKVKIEKWKRKKKEESSKNLDELLNNLVMKSPHQLMNRFSKAEGLDEYAIRKKIIESKTTDLNTKPSETVDDEDDVFEVQTVSLVKTNKTKTVTSRVDKIDQTSQKQGISFKKIKACFVCKSIDH
ncbi:hypothetical protein Tco_0467489 [Tanacetum coccineum]